MTDLELVEQHLTQELEQRREGGEKCPTCSGRGKIRYWQGVKLAQESTCPICQGVGRPPAITAAEETLAAVQRVREGVAKVRELIGSDQRAAVAPSWVLKQIDTSAPLTTEERKQA